MRQTPKVLHVQVGLRTQGPLSPCQVWYGSDFTGRRGGQKGLYTLNHKKRDILFLTITLANLNRFL